MRVAIRPCRPSELDSLVELARRTYDETFRHLNDPRVIDAYLDTAFTRDRIRAELNNPASSFFFLFAGDDKGFLENGDPRFPHGP